jgi:outer membrane protein OmpA-like peptidoglycan-associated protein
MNILRRITGAVLYALILAGAGALAPAGAQVNTGDPNVIVDLSVFEDAGYGAAPVITPSPPPARPAPGKKGKPAPAAKPTAAPSAALTAPPPTTMAETAAKTQKTPAARPGGKPKAREKDALPPAGTPLAPGRAMQIVFKSRASKLPDTAKAGLKTLAAKLKGQPVLRLLLMAYAGGESLSSGKARRLSLARALSVRSYLIENGVRTTRVDARPHGNKTAEEPLNRVDVIVVER